MKIELLLFSVGTSGMPCLFPIYRRKRSGGAPSILWNGSIINLMELIASLDYSGFITNDNGSRQSFAGLVAAFEELVFPNHTICVQTSQDARKTSPSCFRNSRRIMRKTL